MCSFKSRSREGDGDGDDDGWYNTNTNTENKNRQSGRIAKGGSGPNALLSKQSHPSSEIQVTTCVSSFSFFQLYAPKLQHHQTHDGFLNVSHLYIIPWANHESLPLPTSKLLQLVGLVGWSEHSLEELDALTTMRLWLRPCFAKTDGSGKQHPNRHSNRKAAAQGIQFLVFGTSPDWSNLHICAMLKMLNGNEACIAPR